MNVERFSSHKDTFDILDLRAHFHFKSSTSIGFRVGPIPSGPFSCTVFGFLQVHHPCAGHIQAHVYVQLPRRYREAQLLSQIRETAFREFGIADDETYEVHYTDATDGLGIDQRTNREGFVDAI